MCFLYFKNEGFFNCFVNNKILFFLIRNYFYSYIYLSLFNFINKLFLKFI